MMHVTTGFILVTVILSVVFINLNDGREIKPKSNLDDKTFLRGEDKLTEKKHSILASKQDCHPDPCRAKFGSHSFCVDSNPKPNRFTCRCRQGYVFDKPRESTKCILHTEYRRRRSRGLQW